MTKPFKMFLRPVYWLQDRFLCDLMASLGAMSHSRMWSYRRRCETYVYRVFFIPRSTKDMGQFWGNRHKFWVVSSKNTVVRTRAWFDPVQVQEVLAFRRNRQTLLESKMFQHNVLHQQYRRDAMKPWNTSWVKRDETLGLMRKQTKHLSPKILLRL